MTDITPWTTLIADDVPVLIVGAGPVGAGLAVELALRGIRPLLIDAVTEPTELHARPGGGNHRTLEHFRRWGLADAIQAIADSRSDQMEVRFCLTERSGELGGAFLRYSVEREDVAEAGVEAAQHNVVSLLWERAASLGAE